MRIMVYREIMKKAGRESERVRVKEGYAICL